jgi:hypothetical protein
MYTTLGFTRAAMLAYASLRAIRAELLAAGAEAIAVVWAAERLGRLNRPATSAPAAKEAVTMAAILPRQVGTDIDSSMSGMVRRRAKLALSGQNGPTDRPVEPVRSANSRS